MKKKSIFLSILGSCLGIGILLIIIGFALGGRIQSLAIQPSKNTSTSHELPDVSLTDTTDIQNLDFDIAATSIKIQNGDSFAIEGGKLSTNKVSDGTWHLETTHSFTIDLFGNHIHIPFLGFLHDYDSIVTITIPANVTLKEINFDFDAADVSIEKIVCSNDVDIDLSAGSLSIDAVQANNASFDVKAGDIHVGQYNISNTVSLDCSAGNITFGKQKYATQNICRNLEADCSMGNIDIFGKLTGENYLDCSMGDINLNLVGSNANYTINKTDSTMGDISYSTKNFLKEGGNTSETTVSEDNNKFGSLDLSCTMGDIDVYFLYLAR